MAGLSQSANIVAATRGRARVPWGGMMADQQSVDYFRRRERAERAAAKNAGSDAARRAHQELAQGYAELVRNT